MKFIYGKQDFKTLERGEENCYLMTNGLGGFSSLTMTGSCSRNDHAVLMACAALEAPNHRYNMIHRLEEVLTVGDREIYLSTQDFADHARREEGYRYLMSFVYENYPVWRFAAEGVEVCKRLILRPGENTVGFSYEIRNRSSVKAVLRVTPQMEFTAKGTRLKEDQTFELDVRGRKGTVRSNGRRLYFESNGEIRTLPPAFRDDLYYAYDACDGRAETGCTAVNHCLVFAAEPGCSCFGAAVYSTEPKWSGKEPAWSGREAARGTETARSEEEAALVADPVWSAVEEIAGELTSYREKLKRRAGFQDETAQALALAANQFISYRASTDKQTILAGFPFFEDWGRDTMIALTGCCISTGQTEAAESILRTFMLYCKRGLMPNLFPEGAQEPRYNTADAALLFILAVYEYYRRTKDKAFVLSAWSVMEEIVKYYEAGTDFHIGMDEDGLIHAGAGYDQVTWMDVRIGEILPTPRHGKPVEINAYWYNALRIMDLFQKLLEGQTDVEEKDYRTMAERTAENFRQKFWNEKTGCLRDVLSDDLSAAAARGALNTDADLSGPEKGQGAENDARRAAVNHDEQIRCNQIWAVSLPFSLLDREQERKVVETVFARLYTPLGLRTLDPADPEFQPFYGGELMARDLAYHQGTVWTFPLGGYYLAYLKVNDYSEEAKACVRAQLESITAALREGCIGQLPEIYDGQWPVSSKGCFAQAWSVGELLRVYEALERG